MIVYGAIFLAAAWVVWLYPFVFRAPHGQKRASITRSAPTRIGLVFETAAIFLAYLFHYPWEMSLAWWQFAVSLGFIVPACVLSWTAVKHLGKQFRVTAGLYEDHELVRTGPYAVVRHPIYAGLFAMLLATIVLVTRWEWAVVSILLFIAGTEIRVHTEDKLLASRFPEIFPAYRQKVPAYIPFLR